MLTILIEKKKQAKSAPVRLAIVDSNTFFFKTEKIIRYKLVNIEFYFKS